MKLVIKVLTEASGGQHWEHQRNIATDLLNMGEAIHLQK